MNKLRYLNILFLFTGFIFSACSGSRQVTSQFNNDVIKIDGNSNEWKQMTNIKNENISFGFSNDSNFVYISMITNDKNKIMNILGGGLEVWIDPGKTEDKIGIRYPEKPDPGEMMEQMKKQGFPDRPNMDRNNPGEFPDSKELDPGITQFLSTQKLIYIINEDGRVLKSYPLNSNLYQVNMKVDKNSLCYELKVPLGTNPLLNYSFDKDSKGKIGVEIVSGDIKSPFDKMPKPEGPGSGGDDMKPSGPPPGGGGGPGGGGPPPGGGGPGGRPGAPGMGKQTNAKVDYSFEVILAK